MAITGTLTNHFKYMVERGALNLKAQTHNVELTWTDATDKISRAAGSFVTDGWEVGDRLYSNSANAANVGPFIVKVVAALELTLMNLDGTATALTGETTTMTIGTYLIKVLLMRSGFVFSQDNHATRTNLKGTITAATIAFVDGGAGDDSITDTGNGFLTAGFVPGNKITITGGVNDTVVVTALTVAAGTITLATGSITAEAAGAARTLTANDELATANGYTQETKLTGLVTHTEDDSNNRGNAVFPSVSWTPNGGTSIGPTPGACLFLDSSSDNTIIGYIDFDGEQTATDPTLFTITGITIRES